MKARRAFFGFVLALAAPAAVRAQSFGNQPVGGQSDAVRGADPIDIEIVQAGLTVWRGQLTAGIGYGAAMELYSRSPDIARCDGRAATAVLSTHDMDRLALTIQWQDSQFIRDRYAVTLERRRVVAIPSVPGTYGWECREARHHNEDLSISAAVRLPPGQRVRVDGARGFEIFLSRPATAVTPEARQGAEQVAPPRRADFDVVIERSGERLWEGSLHQETGLDRVVARGGNSLPVAIPCRARARAAACPSWRREQWELILKAQDADTVDLEFSAQRDEPSYKSPMDGQLGDRADQLRVSTTPRLPLAEGGSTSVQVQDYVVRVSRR